MVLASIGRAATYYVHNDGNDSANGTSHDSAWASLDKVNDYSFAPGDSVLFLEGGHWEGQLRVNSPGTAAKPTVIGAYFLRNGAATPGFKTARPVIDGSDRIPEQFDGLIRIRADRVRIINLQVVNSEGRSIQFENSNHGEVIDCVTVNSYKSGIKFVNSPNGLVSGNSVSLAGVASPEDGVVWGGAIELVASSNGTIRNNTVTRVYGEGINVNHGSANSIIEDNYVFAARAVGIYVDAAPNTTVRRNIVIGTADPTFWRNGSSVGAGIALNNEAYHYDMPQNGLATTVQSRDAKVYANLVAFASSGVSFWGQLEQSSFDNAMVFNNTFVDNGTQVTMEQKPKPGASFVNNIVLSLSPGTRDVDRTTLGGMIARNNYFGNGDPGGDYSHASNRYTGLTLARMSDWRTFRDANQLTWNDFLVLSGSSVIGAGGDVLQTLSLGDNTFNLDFNRQPHNTPMDIGALSFSELDINTPKKPRELVATPH
jgi:parallel beta-helix repeat protein